MNTVSISVNDSVTIINMIDICAERGVFKGNELLTVGTIREKLVSLIKTNEAPETSN